MALRDLGRMLLLISRSVLTWKGAGNIVHSSFHGLTWDWLENASKNASQLLKTYSDRAVLDSNIYFYFFVCYIIYNPRNSGKSGLPSDPTTKPQRTQVSGSMVTFFEPPGLIPSKWNEQWHGMPPSRYRYQIWIFGRHAGYGSFHKGVFWKSKYYETGPEVHGHRQMVKEGRPRKTMENDCHRGSEDNGDGLGWGRTGGREQASMAMLCCPMCWSTRKDWGLRTKEWVFLLRILYRFTIIVFQLFTTKPLTWHPFHRHHRHGLFKQNKNTKFIIISCVVQLEQIMVYNLHAIWGLVV